MSRKIIQCRRENDLLMGRQANFIAGRVVESGPGRQEVTFWDRTFPFRGYDHLKMGIYHKRDPVCLSFDLENIYLIKS